MPPFYGVKKLLYFIMDSIVRLEYNQVRPHSARNNRPPAPVAILTMTTCTINACYLCLNFQEFL